MEADFDIHSSVKSLLLSNPALRQISSTRILCSLTNHEIPCTEKAITQHIQGKKYKRLSKNLVTHPNITIESFEQYQPHIIPSSKKHHEHQLFCTLTLRHINKLHHHVQRHIDGRKYKNAKARWEQCQATGETFKPTPLQDRNKRNDKDTEETSNDKDEQEGYGSDVDSLSDLYPDMDFDKLTLQEEVVEKQVLSQLKQKKRRRRKRPKSKMSGAPTTTKHGMNSCGESATPAKQMKVMQGVGGSELLVFN